MAFNSGSESDVMKTCLNQICVKNKHIFNKMSSLKLYHLNQLLQKTPFL